LAARYRVGQAAAAFDDPDADAEAAGDEGEAAGDDAAAVALDETADEAVGEAVGVAAVDADEAAVVGLAGGEAELGAPPVHPATPIPTTTATTTPKAARPADLVAPNIADLFPRPRHRS
jgi:hypothetical protein